MTQNRAFFAAAGLLVLIALVCTGGLKLRGTPPAPPVQRVTNTPIHPRPPAPLSPLPDPAPPPDPRGPALTEAFGALARAGGGGIVTCEIPTDPRVLPGTSRAPELEGVLHQDFSAGVMWALVPEAVGAALVLRDGQPTSVATWSDAWPGEHGQCTVEPLRVLEHRVQIAGIAGGGALVVGGNCKEAVLEGQEIVVRHWAWAPCTLTAEAPGESGAVSGTLALRAEEPTNDAVLELRPGPLPESAPPSPDDLVSRALEEPGLSAAARVLLKLRESRTRDVPPG
ncbi:MAG: hypothetical protein R3F61_38050 [Myxococcota bacterium]